MEIPIRRFAPKTLIAAYVLAKLQKATLAAAASNPTILTKPSWLHLPKPSLLPSPKHKWLSKLLGYDYMVYKPGKSNQAAGALSRVTSYELLLMAVSTVEIGLFKEIQASWQEDEVLHQVIQGL